LRDAIEQLQLAPKEIERRAEESRKFVEMVLQPKPRPRAKRR